MQIITNIQLKQISAKDSYVVRHPVLRKGLAQRSCAFDRDEDTTTIHLGAFENNALVGVLSLLQNTADIQLRGMAVLESHQGLGIGKTMIAKAEEMVKELSVKKLWMNARLIAVPFYESCGYTKEGVSFELPYGGMHYKMTKTL